MNPRRAPFHLVGTGPGDPDLLTLAARRLLERVDAVWAVAAAGTRPRALDAVRPHLRPDLPVRVFELGMRAGEGEKADFYAALAEEAERVSGLGEEVALLCLGDPLFYGTAARVLRFLDPDIPVRIHPGVNAVALACARLAVPLALGEEVVVVTPATLPDARLRALLEVADVLVVLKVGGHLRRLKALLAEYGRLESAWLAAELSGEGEAIWRLDADAPLTAPYMSLVIARRDAA